MTAELRKLRFPRPAAAPMSPAEGLEKTFEASLHFLSRSEPLPFQPGSRAPTAGEPMGDPATSAGTGLFSGEHLQLAWWTRDQCSCHIMAQLQSSLLNLSARLYICVVVQWQARVLHIWIGQHGLVALAEQMLLALCLPAFAAVRSACPQCNSCSSLEGQGE